MIYPGRVLVLAHTHAACDVFSSRIADRRRVEVRTIDSLISQIGSAYFHNLGLPSDVAEWTRQQGSKGYQEVAKRVARLLSTSPMISTALARRYPIVICDEHQDASTEQHAVVMAMYSAGASLRVFGDPMQHIGKTSKAVRAADVKRWDDLKAQAEIYDELDRPHRWERVGTRKLGEWILKVRKSLKEGGKIDLRSGLPLEVSIIFADNQAQRHGQYRIDSTTRRPIDGATRSSPLLVLSAQNDTVQALRPFFNRAIPVWEGHTRDALAVLANAMEAHRGDGVSIARAAVTFVEEVRVGFTKTNYSNILLDEVANGCTTKRKKKPALIQELGRFILAEPDHLGVSKMLAQLAHLVRTDDAFRDIKLDHPREYREAILLGDFETCATGMTEISRRRTYARPMPPQRALSTVHKAKGLETDHVLVMPCDIRHFADSAAARCLLYVAISRATHSLTLVVPRTDPSPLLEI
jgi:DNA helicase-2/ATP-dependent DNA helicase PcrA